MDIKWRCKNCNMPLGYIPKQCPNLLHCPNDNGKTLDRLRKEGKLK